MAEPLSRSEVRAVYDRVGRWQDTQVAYEAPALDALVAHAGFEAAQSLWEIGCGTGRFAARILGDVCSPDARYTGIDLSPTMVEIARDRLASFGERATVVQTDGAFSFECPDGRQDRVIATYVLDLLPASDIRSLLAEAHRLLDAQGRLCLAGLTWGDDVLGRIVAHAWSGLQSVRPRWVGGCRPLRMARFVESGPWRIEHREVVRRWGVPSEVLVARPA